MDVAAADRAGPDGDKDLVGADLGNGGVHHLELTVLTQQECFHCRLFHMMHHSGVLIPIMS